MNDVNLNSLKIFMEVASSNSFLEASNKLYISQPAISRSIAKLESDLGIKLFYRANKGISLTPSGTVLLKYLKDSKDLLQSCERVLLSMNDVEDGTIVIGVQSHIVRNYLMDKICDFRRSHVNIKIKLLDCSTVELLDMLEKGKVDFVVDSSPIDTIYNNIIIDKICCLDTGFVKSCNNKSNIKKMKDLEGECVILPLERSSLRKNINKCFIEADAHIVPKLEVGTEELIIDAVRRNIGVGYVIKDAVKYLVDENLLEYIELKDQLPQLEINLVYIDNYLNKISRLFIDTEIRINDSK